MKDLLEKTSELALGEFLNRDRKEDEKRNSILYDTNSDGQHDNDFPKNNFPDSTFETDNG